MIDDLLVALFAFMASFLVGVTSIGGVLVVPGLVFAFGYGVHDAITATLLAGLPGGILALAMSLRRGTLDRRMCAALWLGALPGAFAGAALLPLIPAAALLWLVVAILLASGARSLVTHAQAHRDERTFVTPSLAAIGAGVGVLSAITGTGGPIWLMPILVWRYVAPLTAVALCQAIVVPIAVFASLGNFATGDIDLRLALILALPGVAGIFAGVRVAHALRIVWLHRAVALVMIATGMVIAARLLLVAVAPDVILQRLP